MRTVPPAQLRQHTQPRVAGLRAAIKAPPQPAPSFQGPCAPSHQPSSDNTPSRALPHRQRSIRPAPTAPPPTWPRGRLWGGVHPPGRFAAPKGTVKDRFDPRRPRPHRRGRGADFGGAYTRPVGLRRLIGAGGGHGGTGGLSTNGDGGVGGAGGNAGMRRTAGRLIGAGGGHGGTGGLSTNGDGGVGGAGGNAGMQERSRYRPCRRRRRCRLYRRHHRCCLRVHRRRRSPPCQERSRYRPCRRRRRCRLYRRHHRCCLRVHRRRRLDPAPR